ncbi:MAG: heme-copper oxidase subunit III [Chloroflexi bacterium]|nr:heme-copper oxidase subunit III [Chloroflexota bacterium]
MQHDVLEQELSRQERLALKNRRTGMTIFQISWMMVFVCLIVVHWQIRANFAAWPPEGIARLGLGLPTLATGLLLASGWTVRGALRRVQRDQPFLGAWRATLALGAIFVAIMAWEWLNAPVASGADRQYGMVFRVMTAFHAVHALVIGLYMWRVDRRAILYGSRDFWAVEAGAKLWYFVVAAWIMFYVVLYWV